jgi:hypothetical protein
LVAQTLSPAVEQPFKAAMPAFERAFRKMRAEYLQAELALNVIFACGSLGIFRPADRQPRLREPKIGFERNFRCVLFRIFRLVARQPWLREPQIGFERNFHWGLFRIFPIRGPAL